jgi:hypothetical protein
MSEQQKLPGLDQETAREWAAAWIGETNLDGQDAVAIREAAFKLIPNGLLPDADKLRFQWFSKQFNGGAVDAGFRIRTVEVTDKDGKIVKDDNGVPKRQRVYADQLKLPYEEVFPGWVERMRNARFDELSVRRDVEAYRAAHPNLRKSVDEIMDSLREAVRKAS